MSVTFTGGDRTLEERSSIVLEVDVQATGGAGTGITWNSSDANGHV